MDGDILFLAHRLPFPPDRGDRIRSANILRALAALAPVHVGCLADSEEDRTGEAELASLAASHCVVTRGKPLALAGIEALLKGMPVSLTAFADYRLHAYVRDTLAKQPITAIYVFSGQMGQYVPADYAGRLVVDLCDVDSVKFENYAASGRSVWLNRREARLLAQVETALARRADHTLLISQEEAGLLAARIPEARSIRVLGNGIDAEHFAPHAVSPAALFDGSGPHIVFTGQMDYAPNVSAVIRMVQRIMPEVCRLLPNVRFHIVGRSPAHEVRALDGQNGTVVHGEVPDVRPYLAAANLAVAPLTIARGVQNKVLEAMAMARPVILSPEAATGISATSGTHFQVAETDAAFIAHILRLATDPVAALAMGEAARRFVIARQSWPAMLADLPAMLGLTETTRERRDAA
ncbi:MAG: TIGR03087 family PEP-CTERM/XrtA system glycosyltransferase [Alteraurantiacibacter sp.]|nr:TIGR03087 family PEP-CTERM/XrtA system glycosyltransferase [Alteraurantiacibacter sp.]